MEKSIPQRKQPRQFTRDDVARMVVITLDQVLEALHVQQIVEGIALLPAGEDVYLVDIVMRNLTTKSTWGMSVTIPPPQEVTDERTVDISVPDDPYCKPFAVLNFSRQTLRSLDIIEKQVSSLTDEDMERIAASLANTYPDFLERVRLNVTLYLR